MTAALALKLFTRPIPGPAGGAPSGAFAPFPGDLAGEAGGSSCLEAPEAVGMGGLAGPFDLGPPRAALFSGVLEPSSEDGIRPPLMETSRKFADGGGRGEGAVLGSVGATSDTEGKGGADGGFGAIGVTMTGPGIRRGQV